MQMSNHWFIKYRPQKLDQLGYLPNVTQLLGSLAGQTNLPHMIIHGAHGVGKYTRVNCLLQKLYGTSVHEIQHTREFLKMGDKIRKQMYSTSSSNYHVELNISQMRLGDKHIVQNVIKDLAIESDPNEGANPFKIIVIRDACKLSKEAQAALRSTMEKYVDRCRMIFICNQPHKIIDPIRSRCLKIRMRTPNLQDISEVLMAVSKKAKVETSSSTVGQIAKQSQGNFRQAINLLQIYHLYSGKQRVLALIPQPRKRVRARQVVQLLLSQAPFKQADKIQSLIFKSKEYMMQIGSVFTHIIYQFARHRLPEEFFMDMITAAADCHFLIDQKNRHQSIAAVMSFIYTCMIALIKHNGPA